MDDVLNHAAEEDVEEKKSSEGQFGVDFDVCVILTFEARPESESHVNLLSLS